jgi:hypothetical protein
MMISRRFLLASLAAGLAVPAAAEAGREIMLFKAPSCGCCDGHAAHLRAHGLTVHTHETHDLVTMSRAAGIPDALQGCHLALVGGYAVSGHVPAPVVLRLLVERPPVRAITLPGMPVGSPGMPGPKTEPLRIWAIGVGAPALYAVE